MGVRNFRGFRSLVERLQRRITPSPWPARIAEALGLYHEVALSHHRVAVDQPLGSENRLRIAFASDFHAGPTTVASVLVDAAARLRDAAPDLVLLGGDFVSLDPRYAEMLGDLLSTVHAPLGAYAVLGNHDYWAGAPRVRAILESARIRMVTNRAATLPPPYDRVTIVGLDDHMAGHPDGEAAFDRAGPVRVVLMHQPSGLLDIGERPFHLAVSGHTHGGQIVLPGGWRPVLPWGALSRAYPGGWYDLGRGRTLLVSRGVGCTTLPVRYGATPEVHLIEMVAPG